MDIRLKKQKDFDAVFSKGKRVYSKTLTLLYIPNNNFKFGISLSKKHGKANIRNRIKRLIRASVREVIKGKTLNNYNVVILPKVLEEYSFIDIKNDVLYTFKKGNIVND
ncbi:MAG: ribonuclease P protein component [Clostridia bacterium]|nr:ribonuclease P protein component [Clostridia bacterium]